MNYKKFDEKDLAFLKSLIPQEDRILFDDINEEYSHDELSGTSSYPDVVVIAVSTEEISAIMKYAYENN